MNSLKTSTSILLLTFLFSAAPILAQSVTPTKTPRREDREERQENKQEKETEKQNLRVTNTQIKLTTRLENAQNIAKKIRLQLTQRFDSLEKIKSRLDKRIAAIETANATAKKPRDLTAAKAKLATYDFTKYQSTLADFDKLVGTLTTSGKPLTLVPALRTSANTVRNELKILHQVLIDTLRLIVKAH